MIYLTHANCCARAAVHRPDEDEDGGVCVCVRSNVFAAPPRKHTRRLWRDAIFQWQGEFCSCVAVAELVTQNFRMGERGGFRVLPRRAKLKRTPHKRHKIAHSGEINVCMRYQFLIFTST